MIRFRYVLLTLLLMVVLAVSCSKVRPNLSGPSGQQTTDSNDTGGYVTVFHRVVDGVEVACIEDIATESIALTCDWANEHLNRQP